jgi:hypothetical protein
VPATVNANSLAVVHASSTGITQWFPDVCKTPSPGGPIPIPYPNIAMSSDTADASTTVKNDGNPIMLKGSNYKMSTGDEAGSAMGVASNKIKGKAEPVNTSFDVKADGKGVYRLTDPMTHNAGSTPNGGGTPTGEPPVVGIPKTSDACKAVKEKKKQQKKAGTSWGDCGIIGSHRGPIQAVATEQKVVIYFRRTKGECGKWIAAKHMPKPHSVLAGTTIIEGTASTTQAWLDNFFYRMTEAQQQAYPKSTSLMATNRIYSFRGTDYIGIVGRTAGAVGEPIRGFGTGQSGADYSNKWITGDYDLFQVLVGGEPCKEVCQDGEKFAQLQAEINGRLKWDAIQHGPQVQWSPTRHEIPDESIPLFKMREVFKRALRGDPDATSVRIAPGRKPMQVVDTPLTVVAGNGVTTLESEDEVKKSFICKECEK